MILNLIYQGSGRRPLLAILPEKVNHDFYLKWFRRGGNLRLSWSLIQCLREKEEARSSHFFVVLSEGYLRNADAWVSSLKFLHMLKYPHPPSTQCAIFALNSHSYGPYASKHDNDLLIHYPLLHLSVLLQIEATSAIKHTVRQMHKHVHIKRKRIAFSGCISCDVPVLAISPIIRPLH